MEDRPIYPFITLPEGQFTIVDGFLINLIPETMKVDPREAIETYGHHESRFFREYAKFNTLCKMEKIGGNFFITNHSLFFRLMGIREFVSFVKSRDRYYCRKCDKSKATHVAFSLNFTDRRKPMRAKYVVFERALKSLNWDIRELYGQQSDEFEKANRIAKLTTSSLSFSDYEKNLGCTNVEYLTRKDLLKIAKSSKYRFRTLTGERFRKSLMVNETPLEKFQEKILRHCEMNSFWRLKQLIKLLEANKELVNFSLDTNIVIQEGEKLIRKNLGLINKNLLPILMQYSSSTVNFSKIPSDLTNKWAGGDANKLAYKLAREDSFSEFIIKLIEKSTLNSSMDMDIPHLYLKQYAVFCGYTEQSKIYIQSFIAVRERCQQNR